MKQLHTFKLLGLALLLASCMADIRTPLLVTQGLTPDNETRGKALLEKTWQIHGFDQFNNYSHYSFEGKDIWKGMMGKMGKPWPEAQSNLSFKYAAKSFDAQVHFKNGKAKGTSAGLQSWNYYEIDDEGVLEFKEMNHRIRFGISAYHYFIEMLDRLKRAPIISYAGTHKFRETEYDLVFATWEQPEPHMEHDQYVLWVNRETGMLDFAVYSLRENYLKIPGYKMFYGSIEFSEYQNINGVLIPYQQTVYLNKPKKNRKRHIHRMTITDFQFESFKLEDLYPDPKIKYVGDNKKKGSM